MGNRLALGCHRLPERCFTFRGKSMPMCARCLGTAAGHTTALVLFFVKMLPPAWLCLVFIAVMFLDWFIQDRYGIMSTNPRRLITGLLGGVGVGAWWWMFFSRLVNYFAR